MKRDLLRHSSQLRNRNVLKVETLLRMERSQFLMIRPRDQNAPIKIGAARSYYNHRKNNPDVDQGTSRVITSSNQADILALLAIIL